MAAPSRSDDDMITGINVTPLVDIALVLLIVFMVTAKVLLSPAVTMNLPPSASSTEVQSPLTLELRAGGEVLIGGEKAASDAAVVAVAQGARARDQELRAIIRADRATPHGRVIRAIDLLKQAGISKIAFAVAPGAGDGGPLVPGSERPQ
jgi:biopolymer transport protein ExbD